MESGTKYSTQREIKKLSSPIYVFLFDGTAVKDFTSCMIGCGIDYCIYCCSNINKHFNFMPFQVRQPRTPFKTATERV